MPQDFLVAISVMKLEIGKVLKAQGIKGELKLSCFLDDASMLVGLKQLYIGTRAYSVRNIRPDGNFCYVLLDGIADRNAAEELRNSTVWADKESIEIPQNRYFVEDLLDCVVTLQSGKTVGRISDVLQYGAADVIVCADGSKTISFPFLNDVVNSVDIRCKRMVVDDKRFEEVAVYED